MSHSEPRALLYYANVLDLQRRTQAASNSGRSLDEYRVRRLAEQTDSSMRALISFFFPLFALANSFYELLVVARRFHRFADPNDVVDIVFMTLYLAFDLWQTFTPAPRSEAQWRVSCGARWGCVESDTSFAFQSWPGAASGCAFCGRVKTLGTFQSQGRAAGCCGAQRAWQGGRLCERWSAICNG